MTRTFTGDLSTGDFRQYLTLANKHIPEWEPGYESVGGFVGVRSEWAKSPYLFPPRRFYSMQAVSQDKDAGYVARHELRQNDSPYWGGGARSECIGGPATIAPSGSTMWYAISLKFDSSFPANHQELGWSTFLQFRPTTDSAASPPLVLGHPGPVMVNNVFGPRLNFESLLSGYWFLYFTNALTNTTIPVFSFPYDYGKWHDVKLQIKWATDNTGFMRVWWNGQRQTLFGGVDTVYGPTIQPGLIPNSYSIGGVISAEAKPGYYRSADIVLPGIVYNTGFRIASTEAGL